MISSAFKNEILKIDNLNDFTEAWSFMKNRHKQILHKETLNFYVTQPVAFDDKDGHEKIGTIDKVNKKSVTVLTVDGGHWRISTSFIRKRSE